MEEIRKKNTKKIDNLTKTISEKEKENFLLRKDMDHMNRRILELSKKQKPRSISKGGSADSKHE